MRERRRATRISTNLPARWSTSVRSQEGKVVDLSLRGCFVQTGEHPPANKVPRVQRTAENTPIQIELQMSDDRWLKLDGEVVYEVESTGFAVRFLNVSLDQEQVFRSFIEKQEVESSGTLPFPRV